MTFGFSYNFAMKDILWDCIEHLKKNKKLPLFFFYHPLQYPRYYFKYAEFSVSSFPYSPAAYAFFSFFFIFSTPSRRSHFFPRIFRRNNANGEIHVMSLSISSPITTFAPLSHFYPSFPRWNGTNCWIPVECSAPPEKKEGKKCRPLFNGAYGDCNFYVTN